MKNVVCAGDSFTWHSSAENRAWPWHLDSDKYTVHLCAEMGSSNTMIARNALYQLSKFSNYKDVVLIVGWSSPDRFEFRYDKSHHLFSEIKKVEKTHHHKVTNFLCDNDTSQSAWLKSTGSYGIWDFDNSDIDQIMSDFFSNYHSDTNQYIDTMQSILMLQQFCQVHRIPMLNFKAWDNSVLTQECPEADHIVNMIDMSNWWTHNNTQGLREWAVAKGDVIPNGMHPGASYQRMFCEEIITKFLKGT